MRHAGLPPALILGGGVNGLGAVRELGSLGVFATVFDPDPINVAFASRFARRAVTTPADDGLALELILAETHEAVQPPVVIATSDRYLALISEHRDALAGRVRMVIPSIDRVRRVIDKARFNEFAWETTLGVARGVSVTAETPREHLLESLARMTPPILIKPSVSGAWTPLGGELKGARRRDKAVRFESADAVRRFIDENPESLLTAQEYIPGPDDAHYSYMAYRNAEGQELVAYGVRKHRLRPIHNGVASFVGLVDDAALHAAGQAILDALGYVGPSSVCFKRHAQTGALVCYEVNGRVPLSHQAGRPVRRSLVSAAYLDACGLPVEVGVGPITSPRYWVNLLADLRSARDYRRAGELGALAWLRSLLRVGQVAEWQWNDPRPFVQSICRRRRRRRRASRPPPKSG
jgi:D-aspartate ligase